MNKKSVFSVTALLVFALGMSACGKNIQEIAAVASKELGVTITVNAESNDVCARRQLVSFYDDYKKLSVDDQTSAKQLLQTQKGVTINATAMTGRMTGEESILVLASAQNTTKILTDHRKLQGVLAKTQITKGDDGLTVTTQGAVDVSDKTTYSVASKDLYDLIENEDGDVLKRAVKGGQATALGKSYGTIIQCGDFANVHELL